MIAWHVRPGLKIPQKPTCKKECRVQNQASPDGETEGSSRISIVGGLDRWTAKRLLQGLEVARTLRVRKARLGRPSPGS